MAVVISTESFRFSRRVRSAPWLSSSRWTAVFVRFSIAVPPQGRKIWGVLVPSGSTILPPIWLKMVTTFSRNTRS